MVMYSNHICDTCVFTRYRFLLQEQPPLIVRDSREPPSRCPIITSIHIFLSIPWQCLFQSKIDALFYSYVLHEIISYPESKNRCRHVGRSGTIFAVLKPDFEAFLSLCLFIEGFLSIYRRPELTTKGSLLFSV